MRWWWILWVVNEDSASSVVIDAYTLFSWEKGLRHSKFETMIVFVIMKKEEERMRENVYLN